MCDDVRLPNVDGDEEKYGQIDQDTKNGAVERRMVHITSQDRKRNTWIRAITRVTDARERVTRLKWQYAGHNWITGEIRKY